MKPQRGERHRAERARDTTSRAARPTPQAGPRGGRLQLLALGALTLAIQLAYLADSHDAPTFWRPIVDARVYDEMAHQIAAGTFVISTPYYHPPLFIYFLAAVYRVTGDGSLAAKLVLALVGALTVMLTALIARRLMGRGAAWIAGAMAALCGPLIFYNAELLPAGLAAMLNMLFLYWLLQAVESGAPALWLAAGVAAGLAADTVPNILLFLPLVPLWLLWRHRARGIGRAVLLPALLLFAGAAAAILPVTLANYRHSGQFCLISNNGGLNLYIGNNLNADETIAIRPGFGWENLDKLPMRNGVLREVDANRFYIDQTLGYATAHPGHFVAGLLKKARQVTNARELPRNTDIYVHREWSAILSATVWRLGPFGFPFGVLFPLACLGMIVGCRKWPGAGLLALYIGAYAASVVAIFVAARYRVVLVPALIVFAACALVWLWERRADVRGLALAAGVLLATGVWANTPISAPTDRIPFVAEMHDLLALQSIRDKDYARAQKDLDVAIARAPDYAEARHTQGVLELALGRLPEARDAFRRATALKPGFSEAHYNLGSVYERLGDSTRAEASFRDAMRESPETARIRASLGALLFREGRVAEAVPLLERAIALDRTAYEAYGMLAWILATSPDASLRDGARAVDYASLLLSARDASDPTLLEALAAGHAETGHFELAVVAQGYAVSRWRQAGREDLALQAEQRLGLYRQRKPFRDVRPGRVAGGAAQRTN